MPRTYRLLVRVSGLATAATSTFRVAAQAHALVVVKAEVAFGSGVAAGAPVLVAPRPIDEALDLVVSRPV